VELGPVQILVVGVTDEQGAVAVLTELRRLPEGGAVRLVDVLFISKNEDGSLGMMEVGDPATGEPARLGAVAAAVVGMGAFADEGITVGAAAGAAGGPCGWHDGETWAVSDAIPPGTSAAVALIEHRWALPLRETILRSDGFPLEDTWLHPADLAVAAVCRPQPDPP
jgi:uncharacterized membrane protein